MHPHPSVRLSSFLEISRSKSPRENSEILSHKLNSVRTEQYQMWKHKIVSTCIQKLDLFQSSLSLKFPLYNNELDGQTARCGCTISLLLLTHKVYCVQYADSNNLKMLTQRKFNSVTTKGSKKLQLRFALVSTLPVVPSRGIFLRLESFSG